MTTINNNKWKKVGDLFAVVASIVLILVLLFTIVAYMNGAFAYAYEFVKCPGGDNNTYPEGTDCTITPINMMEGDLLPDTSPWSFI
jgi:hypothetical protein